MKVILNGAGGHMGAEVLKLIDSGLNCASLSAAVDTSYAVGLKSSDTYFSSLSEYSGEADVIVDFSHHSATGGLLEYAKNRKLPVVVATTGHTCEELELVRRAAEYIPIFFSGNMSVGIAELINSAVRIASAFPDADIEIVETHHKRKLDAPSGTALMIANALRNVRPDAVTNCGRSGHGKREDNEIGISSIRCGDVIGIHEVIIATGSQTITLKHEAHSRALFAEGALTAAAFICGKSHGLYSMDDMLRERN